MGHNINAIIGQLPVDIDKIRHYGLATAFEDGYAILLLDEAHIREWEHITGLDAVANPKEGVLDGELIRLFAKEAGLSDFAVINTDYFAGRGKQNAVLFENGAIVARGDINQMLALLGVVVKDRRDEFEQISLDQYRDSEFYYWSSENNWAKYRPYMIPGRMPDAPEGF